MLASFDVHITLLFLDVNTWIAYGAMDFFGLVYRPWA